MKTIMPSVTGSVVSAVSVTLSCSPSLQGRVDTGATFLSYRPALSTHDECLFVRQGDYWTIGYQKQLVFLKAARGLDDLALLLRNPGREFHVSELVGQVIGNHLVLGNGRSATGFWPAGLLRDADPILDAQAKTEYKRRLEDLRMDLKEAERFNDLTRAEQARHEMDALAEQLASAVGLGGRNRRIGSETERARSAVTKRIKSSIRRIGKSIPSLGGHFATRVKTGYFCSYNPQPDPAVAWKF